MFSSDNLCVGQSSIKRCTAVPAVRAEQGSCEPISQLKAHMRERDGSKGSWTLAHSLEGVQKRERLAQKASDLDKIVLTTVSAFFNSFIHCFSMLNTSKYDTFCRETLNYDTFCRQTLKTALFVEKILIPRYEPKEMANLRCEPTPHLMPPLLIPHISHFFSTTAF